MMDLAVLLEEGDIAHRDFNAQDDVELVVQLDGHRPHLMFDTAAQPTLVEATAHLSLVVAMQFAAQKGGNIGGFDRPNEDF